MKKLKFKTLKPVNTTIRTILVTIRDFKDKDIIIRANGLTYSLMFAIVPILAMVLAIAKGFGFENMIENQLNQSFLGELNLVPTVMGFVERYLYTAQEGVFIGVGLLILIWAVYAFFRNVERSFNGIWNVKQSRSVPRQLTNYISILFLVPVLIVVTSGLSILLNSAAGSLTEIPWLMNMQMWLVKVVSFVIVWFIFTWIYMAIPNTKVKFMCAFIPGVIMGSCFQFLQMLSIYIIMFLGRTSVVYGAFASLPLLMMWLQWSCLLILIGAELSFAIQNDEYFEYEQDINHMSRRYKDCITIYILSCIIKRFQNGENPQTAHEISVSLHIPMRLVSNLLGRLEEIQLIRVVYVEDKEERTYVPALDTNHIDFGLVLDRIDAQGGENFLKDAPKELNDFWIYFQGLSEQVNKQADRSVATLGRK